ncbi:fumarylacetoacetate hydrolase family protein [Zafaria sp. Z1313]|uniref:fumarylacetoacetate hydrolase family protein n=1 Tax=Zafaria sp. Z1313 TaxID=3423202 RepID=UPI003D302DCD
MRLATLRLPAGQPSPEPPAEAGITRGTSAAVVLGDTAALLPGFADVGAFLAADDAGRRAALEAAAERVPLGDAAFATLVTAPSKVFCIGLNYRNHIAETGSEEPRFPTVFTKFADSLAGAHDDVRIPAEDHRIDWEGELAIVVGRAGRRISEADAPAHIAGFAVSNDVSMRGWQGRTSEWTQGKCWEASTPVGPFLVTPDEFDPAARITTRVNGEVVQEDSVADQVFGPAQLVSYLSTMVTLRPGDLILTGTPAGVALGRRNEAGRHPWLVDGDVLETEIEGLGTQRNRIVAE